MLQRYSVRLRIYSWFMKYCHPKLASAGVIAAFPVVTLVGTNNNVDHAAGWCISCSYWYLPRLKLRWWW